MSAVRSKILLLELRMDWYLPVEPSGESAEAENEKDSLVGYLIALTWDVECTNIDIILYC